MVHGNVLCSEKFLFLTITHSYIFPMNFSVKWKVKTSPSLFSNKVLKKFSMFVGSLRPT